jgi:hypothetical protein
MRVTDLERVVADHKAADDAFQPVSAGDQRLRSLLAIDPNLQLSLQVGRRLHLDASVATRYPLRRTR